MNPESRYSRRGVSSSKEDVHKAIANSDKGIFPRAFCKVIPDIAGQDPDWCNVMHADGAGTKSSLAYLYWKETGDMDVWKGIAQDAIVMNTDDLLCAGIYDQIVLSSTIGRNKLLVPGEVISGIIEGTNEFIGKMRAYGINIHLSGGETADVGDVVRTIIVDSTVFARTRRSEVITNENIRPGDLVIGLSSYGKTSYENEYNSGIGSNGLTSARHDVLGHQYADRYPESHDPGLPRDLVYSGNKKLTEVSEVNGINIGKLLLSPTRTYAPVMKTILDEHRSNIHGIIHCSGGAQTKVLRFIDKIRVVKDNMFEIPPVFRLIQDESGTPMEEMFRVFNMGHRLELYVAEEMAPSILDICGEFDLEARIIGHCESADTAEVTILHEGEQYKYRH